MASLSKDKNANFTIQFTAPDAKRRSIRLGKVTAKQAGAMKQRVEALLAATILKQPFDADLASWVAGIGDDLAKKLAAVGLIAARQSAKLAEFLDGYITKRTDCKPRTLINLRACRDRLVEFFGAEKNITTINRGDADAWLLRLKERYANGTAGRTVKRAKQFFESAVRSELITKNPFDDLKPPSQVNESRKHFVTLETTTAILAACPDAEWRLIVALCRFGGLRCPSELNTLNWGGVDWDKGRFLVHSPKKEHLADGGDRWVPLFPQLRPHLEEARRNAPVDAVYVLSQHRDNANLRTRFAKVIKRAGCTPWPKLFQNLRASRETELAQEFPLHVVCAWIGNSAMVANKHYLQVTEDDFARALQKPVHDALQNPVQPRDDRKRQQRTETPQILPEHELVQLLAAAVTVAHVRAVPPRGLEPLSSP